tara:strand:- start:153 stop:431 length:279 start_codon:yes stop_codon:yes gene_type:complete
VEFKLPANIDLAATMKALEKTGVGQTQLSKMSDSAANALINNFAVFKGKTGPRGPGNKAYGGRAKKKKMAYGGKAMKTYAMGGGIRKAKTYG